MGLQVEIDRLKMTKVLTSDLDDECRKVVGLQVEIDRLKMTKGFR